VEYYILQKKPAKDKTLTMATVSACFGLMKISTSAVVEPGSEIKSYVCASHAKSPKIGLLYGSLVLLSPFLLSLLWARN